MDMAKGTPSAAEYLCGKDRRSAHAGYGYGAVSWVRSGHVSIVHTSRNIVPGKSDWDRCCLQNPRWPAHRKRDPKSVRIPSHVHVHWRGAALRESLDHRLAAHFEQKDFLRRVSGAGSGDEF